MKFNRYLKDNKWMPYALAGCVVVLFYLLASHVNYLFIGLGYVFGFISPVILGCVIAYVLDPLVKIFETKIFAKLDAKRQIRRMLAVTVTLVLVVFLLAILMVMLIPQLAKSMGTFFSNFDSYAQSLQNLLNNISSQADDDSIFSFDISSVTKVIDNMIEKLSDYVQNNVGSIVNTSINVGVTIFNIVISFILAIYMLSDKERILAGWRRLMQAFLSDRTYAEAESFWNRCNDILIRYMAGDILDGIIVGGINAVFMSIADMDYIALISVIVGITNLAPTFGPLVGGMIGAFILVFVNPWHALWFIIFTIILQTIDGYMIKPKLFGNTLGISSLWILISIIVFGRMFGVAGILLAIPIAAIFDILYKEVLLHRLEARKKERKAAVAEAEAKRVADYAAMKAAEEAIKAVVKKDSETASPDDEIIEKLSSDPVTAEHKQEAAKQDT